MIGEPINDYSCLASITEVVAELIKHGDPVLIEIARKHHTPKQLAAWIRSLPQKDDLGHRHDGPKIAACSPPQRLRLPAPNPNCVERAALYLGVAELIDPRPLRRLATVDLPIGMHTFPVESQPVKPVVLDPRVTRNGLDWSLALASDGPLAINSRNLIDWSARLAEDGAGTAGIRNGGSTAQRARNAIYSLVDRGIVPTSEEVSAIGWMLAMAERTARRYGLRALRVVRSCARAVIDVLDQAVRTDERRNFGIDIGGMHIEAPKWLSSVLSAAGNVGLDLGAAAAHKELNSLGIGDDIVNLAETELNKQGLSLGVFAHPPRLPTFDSIAAAHQAQKSPPASTQPN